MKNKVRRGRPMKAGKPRKPSGGIRNSAKDSTEALETRLALEAGTWRRMREAEAVGEVITIDEAREQERGSVIHQWLKVSDDFRRKGKPEKALISRDQFDALIEFMELSRRYSSMMVKQPKSASDYDRTGGHDNTDPFERRAEARDSKVQGDFKRGRTAILEASPLAMMAFETIVVENKEVMTLLGDLRLAANALDITRKVRKAA